MIHETERLILRPFEESDAESIFIYASDPLVGPSAGWPVHTSVENSREIIKTILSANETYAVVLKETGCAIGSVGLMIGDRKDVKMPPDEGEVGYWIGVPFWGKGMIPEAVREIMRYGFEDLNLKKIWGRYFDGNDKSRRVMEKCGLKFSHREENMLSQMGESKITNVTFITREEWEAQK